MKKPNSPLPSAGGQAKSIALLLSGIAAAILVLMPFHATLTVWLSQYTGHYLGLRLWKEFLLVVLGLGSLWLLVRDSGVRRRLVRLRLSWLIGAYLLMQVAWGIAAYVLHAVSGKALLYGWISDTRFLVFFITVFVIAQLAPVLHHGWPKLVFWPAAAVVLFGLIQYFVLPYDFMKHLGYSTATIFPYEDINHNIHYIRIMSSLRGANPLGAYLLTILALLAAFLIRRPRQYAAAVFLGMFNIVALALTFSRSAWIGLLVAWAVLVWMSLRPVWLRRWLATGTVCAIVLSAGAAYVLRDDTTFQNIFLHTQTNSIVQTTSNEGHASALQSGLQDIVREPLGRGPGTAGPASVYNDGHTVRIAENYFIQIGQETGWLGLALFITINMLLARALWRRRNDALAAGLLAALIGISAVGLLSHVWADDTLAYVWWGLAALAIARPATTVQKHVSKIQHPD